MTAFSPHNYQRNAIQFGLSRDRCGLFLPMGAGKTAITLSIISRRLKQDVKKVLVIAPVRVAKTTWVDEVKKWDHTKGLTVSVISGTPKQRQKALEVDADIYTIGKENTKWLCDTCNPWKFDMVVIDELSTFKNPQSQRFKALRSHLPFIKYFIGLTGTPAPRGIPDLWSQIYLIDRGERLGRTLSAFRATYLYPGLSNGFTVYQWNVKKGAQEAIQEKLKDVCMSLEQNDCVELPPVSYLDVAVELDKKSLCRHKDFKKNLVLQLDNKEVMASNAGVLCGQLLQIASGEIYTKDEAGRITGTQELHKCKLEALDELLEGSNGEPVLIYYYFKHEKERISKLLKKRGLKYSTLENPEDIRRWNERKIDALLLHPASAGHGLNLQEGGSIIIWYSLPNYNLEYYQQANARLYRQGQKEPVRIYRIIAKDTIEMDMVKALESKHITQQSILEALRKQV